ncbi:MAG: hypothetical protein IKL56_08485 [Bacteroidaceae bacterium]|nr:hypothetical protein [Bacteroidaceae bacterium]
MNDIFDFGRFGKLFVYECRNYLPRYIKGMVVFASFLVAAWLFTIASEYPFDSRTNFITVLFFFAIFLSPYFVYKEMNNRKKGYFYAMLPASTFEKLLSMTLVSVVVVPAVVYLSLSVTDVLLYALSCAGAGYFTGLEFCNPFNLLTDVDIVNLKWNFGDELAALFSGKHIVLWCVMNISVVMMFNSIFRKHKIIKTLLFNMAVQFLFQIAVIFFAVWFPEATERFADWVEHFLTDYTPGELLTMIDNTVLLVNTLVTVVALTITYFRIKRVNY